MKPAPELLRVTPEQCAKMKMPAHLGSAPNSGNSGTFLVYFGGQTLRCDVCIRDRFEDVQITLPHRKPTSVEVKFAARLFWEDNELVRQFLTEPEPFCVHLFVGPKSVS